MYRPSTYDDKKSLRNALILSVRLLADRKDRTLIADHPPVMHGKYKLQGSERTLGTVLSAKVNILIEKD